MLCRTAQPELLNRAAHAQALWELRRKAAQRWGSSDTRSRVSGGVSDNSATFGAPQCTCEAETRLYYQIVLNAALRHLQARQPQRKQEVT